MGTGMDDQSHVSSPGSVRDRVSVDGENPPNLKMNRAASAIQSSK